MSFISRKNITELYKKALQYYDGIESKEKQEERQNAFVFAKEFMRCNGIGTSLFYLFSMRDKEIVLMEGSVDQMLGNKASFFVGKSFFVVLSFLKTSDLYHFIKSAYSFYNYLYGKPVHERTKVRGSMYYNIKNKRGEYRSFLHQTVVALMDEAGNITYTMHVLTDITHLIPVTKFKMFILDESNEEESKLIPIKLTDSNYLIGSVITPSEKKILDLTAQGYTSKQIAYDLNVSEHTVNNHKKNILKKTNSRSITEVIAKLSEELKEA